MLIQKNIALKDKNWFQTGGNTKYFCKPKNKTDFTKAIKFANNNNLQIFVLGEGANILISDNGFDGLTINPNLNQIDIRDNTVTVGAGVKIQDLIDQCLDRNLLGLEDFSNIPGSIGGSLYINIHYFNKFLSNYLLKATVINKKNGKLTIVDKNWFNFGYDQSTLQNKEYYLVNATFKLKKSTELESAYAKGRRDEIIRYRQRQYPIKNSCGSFFKNFHKNEVTIKINSKKMIFVAYYLDKLGIKGNLSVGKAKVSYKHANMIVTENGAKSSDIIKLAQKIQLLCYNKYGIKPQLECQLIGFSENLL